VEKTPSVHFDGFDVCDVKVNNPLIALPSETSHCFRVSARANWSSSIIVLSIYSVDSHGKNKASHATLNVRLSAKASDWLDEWKTMAYLINGRIKALQQGVTSGNTHRLKRRMVYKLFESIVKYNPDYQGMAEVMLDTDELEASANVVFQADENGFLVNPRWIDSLGQIAGFIMNGNENLQSDKQVFINHGWGRMRFGEPLSRDKVYTTYNKMQLVSGTTYAGDTFILDGDRIVAIYEKVTVSFDHFPSAKYLADISVVPRRSAKAPEQLAPVGE
jgi:naphtho-gamma-pyrone polyketide synthase